MQQRFVIIWFPKLLTDWYEQHRPALKRIPFVLAAPVHNKMLVMEASAEAQKKGIYAGITVADAKTYHPSIQIFQHNPQFSIKLLEKICAWCIRFTPIAAVDPPDTLVLNVSGCTHLWGSEKAYLKDIQTRLTSRGYTVRLAMADTIGAAWAVTRFGAECSVIEKDKQVEALLQLPPEALRLQMETIERLHKLGLHSIQQFIFLPRQSLRRRFGEDILIKIDLALGWKEEFIQPLHPAEPFTQHLPCLEPIVNKTGIEIALQKLLEGLCSRLQKEGKGVRIAQLKCYRLDGEIQEVEIGTHRASSNIKHLFSLFALKIEKIKPAVGIELFLLEARKVEDADAIQEKIWNITGGLEDPQVSELLDRLKGRIGDISIRRLLPDEHHWPERSFRVASSLSEKTITKWRRDVVRPILLLPRPQQIAVTAPIPDYPPMMFTYQNKRHKVIKADGPERIEREWWIDKGLQRDYYVVEDEEGKRYWLFREGLYDERKTPLWYLHGFFA